MDENLLGYLLNALDEPTQSEVEAFLTKHPEARARLAVLQQTLAPLAADRDTPAPSPQLVERTLAKVAEHICTRAKVTAELPQAPPSWPATLSMGHSWWRRPDILVAACLLVTVVGVGLMVLASLRAPSSAAMLVECKNNLREYYVALHKYRDQNGQFPDVAKEAPRDVAGMVVPILKDAGVLPASASIRCPGLGSPLSCEITLTALRTMRETEFALHSPSLALCYAYSLGYRDQGGSLHGPGDHPRESWSQTPIMSDRPPAEGVLANSINHDGTGQNVLFADGHILFLPKRTLGTGDDIFVNRDGIVAAGLDATDIVLGYSGARARP
jgi:prepilin-type processing-associated H-X9-DG protein